MIAFIIGCVTGYGIYRLTGYLRGDRWAYSAAIALLPIIYMAFGLFADGPDVVVYEFMYGAVFFMAAYTGLAMRKMKMAMFGYLGVMWLLHGAYDVWHDFFVINSGVPLWYPAFCAGVDIIVGFLLFWKAYEEWRVKHSSA